MFSWLLDLVVPERKRQQTVRNSTFGLIATRRSLRRLDMAARMQEQGRSNEEVEHMMELWERLDRIESRK